MANRATNYLKIVFFGALATLSAATSFAFFMVAYVRPGDHWMYGLTVGVVGVLVTDAAALAWLRIYLNASDNNDERALAMFGVVTGAAGSVVASLAYLLDTTPLFALPEQAAAYATVAGAIVIVIHFMLVLITQYRATRAQIDERMSGLMSEANEEMLKKTDERFRAMIPALADQNARRLATQLAGRFGLLSDVGASGSVEPLPLPSPPQAQATGRTGGESRPRAGADDPFRIVRDPDADLGRPAIADDGGFGERTVADGRSAAARGGTAEIGR